MEKPTNKTNGLGTAGFVLSLIGLILFWLPIPGWILWLLGTLFSFIGLFGYPKGLATAGFIMAIVTALLIAAIIYGLILTI